MTYKPTPQETSKVTLPENLEKTLEIIAESVHDRWAENRIKEGWVYGVNRNDEKKTHPGLRPYNELSESEKEFDRITARETIKVLISLGYKIDK